MRLGFGFWGKAGLNLRPVNCVTSHIIKIGPILTEESLAGITSGYINRRRLFLTKLLAQSIRRKIRSRLAPKILKFFFLVFLVA